MSLMSPAARIFLIAGPLRLLGGGNIYARCLRPQAGNLTYNSGYNSFAVSGMANASIVTINFDLQRAMLTFAQLYAWARSISNFRARFVSFF
jgi:hypothetical protein